MLLQKRIRELDFALEQCQRGTSIPSINLPTPPEFTEPAKQTTPIQIRNLLDKYNPSQVDQFFSEMNLLPILGDTDEMRERFSMEVNKLAKLWPIEIRKQTKLINSPFPGSVEKELDFWQEMDRKLNDTKLQLDGSPVLLTKLVLKRTNTVSAQLIVEVELELDRCLKIANVSLAFLRDFPIEELLVTNTLHPKLSRCITQCLNHFSKLKHSNYSFTRAIRLLEVLGAITLNKIIQILRENDIMRCSVDELRNIKTQCDEVFLAWKTYLSAQRVILKDVAKRRNEKTFTFKFEFDTMQRRINSIVEFREQHEKILEILSVVMVGEDGDFITELSDAYHLVLRTVTDCFDITQIGATTWNSSMQLYEKRLEKVEEHITRILEDRLGKAKSADEMFRIFSTFNPLFFRPTIRNAVNSFRTLLVKNVREDVRRLQDKFKMRYADSFERVTADLRDIPPLSGQIIWARQIENQLATLMRRIQDVLGTGWEDHLEGKQLKEVCDELRGYLDTSQIYEEWLQQQLKIDTNKFSKLKDFLLLVEEDNRSGLKELKVNFDDKLVIVFKEVKYLEWLLPNMSVVHKSIPNTIKTRSTEAYARYPIALALQSALTTFNQAKKNINNSNSMLLVAHVQAVRDIIKEAIGGSKRSKWVKWDTKDLNDWVHHLSVKVYALQERVDDVKEKTILAEQLLEKLKTCEYEREKLEEGISSLQKIADELPMKGLSNISQWVNRLDSRVEEIIRERVKKAVNIWVNSFNKEDQSLRDAQQASKKGGSDVSTLQKSLMSRLQNLKEQANKSEEKEVKVETIQLEQTVHEIVLSNQILFLTPTLEQARKYWMTDFHNYLAVVATLPRIVSTRFQVFAESQSDGGNYGDLLFALEPKLLKQPFLVIEDKIQQAGLYVQQWLQYQALWDASFQVIADRIGNDINKWQQLLDEIKEARKTIETVEEEKLYGPIVINHKQVQNKINAKYDAWQKESQIRFGLLLLDEIKSMHTELVNVKSKLESISLDGKTSEVIEGVEYLLKTKASLEQRAAAVTSLKNSEKLLQNQRFLFPQEWMPVSNVQSVFNDMCSILDRRTASMEAQLPTLELQIKEEEKAIKARTDKFIANWNANRPSDGDHSPADVLKSLSLMSAEAQKLREDTDRLHGAKAALNIDFIPDERLGPVEAEITDLRQSWQAVSPIYEKLQKIRGTPMKDLQSSQLRKELEDLTAELQNVPAKFRSYPAVEGLHEKLSKYISYQPVLRDLSTEALKDRHWKVLMEKLDIKASSPSNINVGNIWESSALSNRKVIAQILSTAQGEAALEQFLRELREKWITSEIQLVMRDTVKVVVGWEDIFTALEDNLNALASLKQSPDFKNVPEFQEDTANWEVKLTHLRGIFNIWVEVQRKWLYLRGIFKNADLKAQLPQQFTKFKGVDNEYLSLIKRVIAKPAVLELLQIDNAQRQLERQDATMAIIQKALGEYLERQRQMFPVSNFLTHHLFS